MAGNWLWMVFSLQLLPSIMQGLRDVQLFHHPTLEALVGQNITLPCVIKAFAGLKIASIEWRKGSSKLVVFHPDYGHHLHWPNVTFQTEKSQNQLTGSYLHLHGVTKGDSGIYNCEITSFPLGSIKGETRLTVEGDVEITCDANNTVEVHGGGNVTIHCRAVSDARYAWTKDGRLVSETESLELWQVTGAHVGVYKLTVNTGNTSLHKDFIITVLTATTSSSSAAVPETLTETALISLATPLTTGPSAPVDRTAHPSTTGLTATAVERTTTWTGSTATHSVPASSTTRSGTSCSGTSGSGTSHSGTSRSGTSRSGTSRSGTPETSHSGTPGTSRSGTSRSGTSRSGTPGTSHSVSSTFRNEINTFRSTQSPESTQHPGADTEESSGTVSRNSTHPGPLTGTSESVLVAPDDKDARQSCLLLALVIIPILLLIAVIGFLYRRQTLKKRMDLPPPFKPPPPPVKYTAVKRSETATHSFPVSRCNSVAEPRETKEMLFTA